MTHFFRLNIGDRMKESNTSLPMPVLKLRRINDKIPSSVQKKSPILENEKLPVENQPRLDSSNDIEVINIKDIVKLQKGNLMRGFEKNLETKGIRRVKVDGDGNCLFSSMSYHSFGDASSHEELRTELYSYMSQVYRKFRGRWNIKMCPKDGEIKADPEAFFVYKMVTDFCLRYEILAAIGLENEKDEIEDLMIEEFIDIKKKKCTKTSDLKRWGGVTDLHLYSLWRNVNVMSISEKGAISRGIRVVCGFAPNMKLITYRCGINHTEEIYHRRDMFLFVNSNHYEPLENKGNYVWKCNEMYDHTIDSSLKHDPCEDCLKSKT